MYQIEDFVFEIINPNLVHMPKHFEKFKTNNIPEYFYTLHLENDIKVVENTFTYKKDDIAIIDINGFEKRYLYIKNTLYPYACTLELDHQHMDIYIHKDYLEMMTIDTMFTSLLSLERRMREKDNFILHCAYIVYKEKAILFSAPSGMGKSTQACLWQQYKDARIINGDRALLTKQNDGYYACGWPICGSSEICINEKYPIACIVTLRKDTQNSITQLSYKQTFKQILSELTVNYHNPAFLNDTLDFVDDLSKAITMYHLSCDISIDAVKCLDDRMKEDQLWML